MSDFIRLLIKIIIIIKCRFLITVHCQEFLLQDNALEKKHLLTTSEALLGQDGGSIENRWNNSIGFGYSAGAGQTSFIQPLHYQLRFRPIFHPVDEGASRFTIPSSVVIRIQCLKATNVITLNSKLINIDNTSAKVKLLSTDGVLGVKNPVLKIKSQTVDELNEEYSVELLEDLEPGQIYNLHLDFASKVFRDRLNGIYLSNYTVPSTNETKYLVVSQFEPKAARLAYPCIDTPDAKATFEISIGRREQYNSLCNMELMKSEPIQGLNGWFWDHYQTTVKMSTYLIAIVVSEFTSEEAKSSLFNGKPVKIWAAKHYIDEQGGALAAQTSARILNLYEEYFDMKYPLPKMDSVAIPHFSAGAMENYGLNTYREKYLLFFPSRQGEVQKLQIAGIIGHELGHQWFGNLVTCRTWANLWLNEGFASFVENIGVDGIYPEFEIWKQFNAKVLQVALQFDQGQKSHPLVNDSLSSVANFDTITYSKGASLIRMMQGFLGENVLKAGLQAYLKKFSFSNTLQDDLFTILNDEAAKFGILSGSNTTLNKIMDTWTLQKGYPLVRVSLANTSEGLYFTQEKFVPVTGNDSGLVNSQKWWIPLKLEKQKMSSSVNYSSVSTLWLPDDSITVYHAEAEMRGNLFLVNPEATGYFRVLYDEALTGRLQTQLKENHLTLSGPARGQLIDDYFTLGFSDYIPLSQALALTEYLDKETEYNVWITVFSNFKKTLRLTGRTQAYEKLQLHLSTKVNAALHLIGFNQPPNEVGVKVLARSFLLGFATVLEDDETLKYAKGLLGRWIVDPVNNKIPNDLQDSVHCAAVKAGHSSDIWDFVHEEYFKETSCPMRKRRLLNALTCTKDQDLIKLLLQVTLDKKLGIDNADARQIYVNFASNAAGRDLLIQFLLTDKIQNVYEKETPAVSITDIITTLSFYLHSKVELGQMESLVNTYDKEIKSKSMNSGLVDTAIQRIQENGEWMNRFYEPMKNWLDNHA